VRLRLEGVGFEWEPRDLWIGVYWRGKRLTVAETDCAKVVNVRLYDLWVCLLPCLPLHVRWSRETPLMEGAR
jgi:hypothetical protein